MKKLLSFAPIIAIAYLVYLTIYTNKPKSETQILPPATNIWEVVKITDGDTITVKNTDNRQLKIRFCGIDAPESKQKLGEDSTKLLTSLIADSNNQVAISEIEKDRYGRTVGEVFSFKNNGGEIFINEELVKNGLAYHYKQYSSKCPNKNAIALAEDIAKSEKVGVWSGEHQPPWEYRKNKKRK